MGCGKERIDAALLHDRPLDYYPFEKCGYIDSNFIIYSEDWYMAAKISKDTLWGVSYGELPGLTPGRYIAVF